MSAQHTPGLLRIGHINHRKQRIDIDLPSGDSRIGCSWWFAMARTYGCEESPGTGSEIMMANARRIVACWNACRDIGTDALERGVVAEMLQALKDCEEAMDYMSEYEIPIALPGRVKAAIDKAEKEDE